MPDILSAVLRALSFVFLLQAAGVALFIALFGRLLSGSADAIRRLGRISAIVGAASVVGHFGLEAPRMAGDFSGMWDLSLQKTALYSAAGVAFGVKVLGLVLLAASLGRDGKIFRTGWIFGAALAVTAFLLTGHTSVHAERWMLAPLLAVHLLIIAFWFGALLPLNQACAREPPVVAAKVVNAFSAIATWLVPVIFLAGLGMAVILVPSWGVFRQPYGELLIVKVVGFAALMGLAALNKWRLGPGIASGGQVAVMALRRSVAAEYVLILGVLTVTAIMTGFFSPQ